MAQIFDGTAEQIENNQNKVTTINSGRTDIEYPSAKAVFNYVQKDLVYSPESNNVQTGKTVAQALKRFDTVLEQGNTFIFDGGFPGEAFDIGYTTDSELDIQSLNPVTNKKVTETQNENLKRLNLNQDAIQNLKQVVNTNKLELTQFKTMIMNLLYPQGKSWHTLKLNSEFKPLDDKIEESPKYKVFGNTVNIKGNISPKLALTLDYPGKLIATLPNEIIPKDIGTVEMAFVCPGSVHYKWVLFIFPNGELRAGRYGSYDEVEVQPYNWLGFNITYQI